jgi:hypothetical protein
MLVIRAYEFPFRPEVSKTCIGIYQLTELDDFIILDIDGVPNILLTHIYQLAWPGLWIR